MRFTFILHDIQEVSLSADRPFISTFYCNLEESDFDSDIFWCGEITPEVESMVENTWKIYNQLYEVYGTITSKLIKKIVYFMFQQI